MALLKSRALELLEAEEELRRRNAEQCYAILEAWQAKEPVITPIVELPAKKVQEDTRPFGYNYGHLPSRNARRSRRWSET